MTGRRYTARPGQAVDRTPCPICGLEVVLCPDGLPARHHIETDRHAEAVEALGCVFAWTLNARFIGLIGQLVGGFSEPEKGDRALYARLRAIGLVVYVDENGNPCKHGRSVKLTDHGHEWLAARRKHAA